MSEFVLISLIYYRVRLSIPILSVVFFYNKINASLFLNNWYRKI